MIRLQAKVGERGQAVIPKAIRDRFGIHPGDTIYYRVEGDEIILDRRSDAEIWQEFRDALPKQRLRKDVDWDAITDSQYDDMLRRAGL